MTGTRASAECAGSLPRSVSTMGRSPATSAGHSSGKNKFQWNQNIIEQTVCSLDKLFFPRLGPSAYFSTKKSSFSFNPGESPRGRQIARARRREPASSTSRWKNIALGVVCRNVSGTKLGSSQDVCVGLIVHSSQGGDEVE